MGRSGDGGLKIDEVEKGGDHYHSFYKEAAEVEIMCRKWQKFRSLTDMTPTEKADMKLKVKLENSSML